MFRLHITLLITFGFVFSNVEAVTFTLEAETTQVTFQKNQRSAASGGYTVLLHQGNEVEFKFCLVRSSNVIIENIYTSNDGDADTMEVKVDGKTLKSFQSVGGSNFGQNWNIISSSGQIGTKFLNAGMHVVMIKVTSSDNYGVELDGIVFNIEDDEITSKLFTCNLQCITDIPTIDATSGITNGKALQKSRTTNCSSNSNVNVPIYHSTVNEYELTASPPLYTTSANNRDGDDKNCPAVTPGDQFFSYQNVIVSPSTEEQTLETSTISFSQQPGNTEIEMIASFTFNEASETNRGSELYLELKEPASECTVSVKYVNKQDQLIMLPSEVFDSTKTEHTWIIPESTWTDAGKNYLFVILESSSEQTISNLRMVIQPIKYESIVVFQSESIKVEAKIPKGNCSLDPRMTLILSSTQTWNNIHSFSIATNLPNGFAQNFVLYDSGTVRLLYPTPSEFDWIPFGTSVILGQANVDDEQAEAPISVVKLNPTDLSMEVTYSDDSKTSLMLMTSDQTTKLRVYNLDFKKDTKMYPFATFRSMYVETGNSEADSIITDSSSEESVLGSWESLEGRTFFLYRTCESVYHTQSPDIKLTITKP